MTIARHYIMTAKDGSEADAITAFKGLADALVNIPGCSGAELLQDSEKPTRFIVIEKWDSLEAHKAGSGLLSKEALAPIMAVLAGPPDGSYLDYLHTV